jgi:hypothetical protein
VKTHEKERESREKPLESPSIYISGLPMDITEEELGEICVYMCLCVYMFMYVYMYIYIYI